ncbi:Piso0_000667 [Millerozyma farinosa CBS 7064]|uniref:Piso0_000667 protein n=1 Tax=Pichia sorbitophila (strain ATCC MYA-4447 / BCRC 22081 / CBS 7064 / NBRC 10061 / NRRL Y-12695) TaxID=559304 RepID=G8YR67_PICSO|nr:Piso0_000667 [Millerozyma farinosa CBS 7064]
MGSKAERQPLLGVLEETSSNAGTMPDSDVTLERAAMNIYETLIDNAEESVLDEDELWLREQREQNKLTHWLRRPSVLMICLPLFLHSFGAASAMSSMKVLLLKLACRSLAQKSPDGVCDPAETQVLLSNLLLITGLASGSLRIFVSGKIGSWSDRYGRKPIISISILVSLLGRCSQFFVMWKFQALQFGLLVVSDILYNSFGGVFTLMAMCNCYVTDVIEPHERIYSLGLSQASLYVGLSLGPIVGNLLLSLPYVVKPHSNASDVNQLNQIYTYEYLPLQFEILVLVCVLLFAHFVLPESRSHKARRKSRAMSMSSSVSSLQEPQGSTFDRLMSNLNFLEPLKLLLYPKEIAYYENHRVYKRQKWVVLNIVILICVTLESLIAFTDVFALLGTYKFHWTSKNLGSFIITSNLTRTLVLIVVAPIFVQKLLQKVLKFKVFNFQFDMVDFIVCSLGIAIEAACMILAGMAQSSGQFMSFIAISSAGGLVSPTLTSALVKYFPESKTGELFGALAILKNILNLCGPFLCLTLYKFSVKKWDMPGIPLIVSGCILFTSLISLFFIKRLHRLSRYSAPEIVLPRRKSTLSLGTAEGNTERRGSSYNSLSRPGIP